jgi:hypothetical protein
MYTSVMLFALTGLTVSANDAELTWLTDYSAARKLVVMEKKPVAIFVAPGQDGWRHCVRGGALTKEHRDILARQYVCLHVDSNSEAGKKLARSLSVPGGLGLVIGDSTGQVMAFHHEGDLAAADMSRYLSRYGDPQYVVRTTETNPPGHETRSYYYQPAPAAPTARPVYYGGYRGGSC